MDKDKFLTVGWNNLLTVVLGLPALTYAAVAFFTSILSDKSGFFGMVAIGVIYWIVIEQHSALQFAWQMKKLDNYISTKQSPLNRITVITYNIVWWIPIVLPFVDLADYRTSSIIFFFVTLARAFANLYRVNVLKLEQAENFPLRGP